MIVAGELDAPLAAVRAEQVPGDPRYGDQFTDSSASIRKLWRTARTAGSTTRELLRASAAQVWDVPPKDCQTADGKVSHPTSGRVHLKKPGEFQLIGTYAPESTAPTSSLNGRSTDARQARRLRRPRPASQPRDHPGHGERPDIPVAGCEVVQRPGHAR